MISARAQTPVEYKITGTVFDESNQGVEKVRVCALPVDYRPGHLGVKIFSLGDPARTSRVQEALDK
jgi:hypothetical protein